MSARKLVIESPTEADIPVLGEMFYADMEDLGVSTTKEKQLTLARKIVEDLGRPKPQAFCLVARLEAKGVPRGVLLANFNWSVKFAGPSLWIEELYVDPEARRHGIGRALVEALLDWSEENGIDGIDLEAYRGNTPASIMYRALGFHRLGRERFYYRIGAQEFL